MSGHTVTAIDYTPDPALSFWPTPPKVADDLVYRAMLPGYGDGSASRDGLVPRVRVLEPSAGNGHLLRAIREYLPGAHVTAVEPAASRAAGLRESGMADVVVESTLDDYLTSVAFSALAGEFNSFDLVVMNPPFTLPDRPVAWAEHFLAIYRDPHLLAPGAQISALVPRIVMTGKGRLVRQVRELLHPYFGIEASPKGAFGPVGAQVSTAQIWVEARDGDGRVPGRPQPEYGQEPYQPTSRDHVRAMAGR